MLASPLEQFVIKPIVPLHIGGVDVSFSQSALCMIIAVALTTVIMTLGMRNRALIPGRIQNIPEMLYEFIFGMVHTSLGQEARKYVPFVFTVYMIVLMGNLLGMFPYAFTYTSHIIVTGALAMTVFVFATAVGFIRHGTHFFSFFLPKGLPIAVAPVIIVIELLSYLSRPISLSVRLFANLTAGHMMVKVCAGFSVVMGAFLGVIPMLVNVALYGFEILIAFIQAYVFAILTSLYLKDAVEMH